MKTIKKVAKAQRGIDVERAATHRGVCGRGSVSDRQAARMDRRAERQARREERQYDREARREERRASRESGGGSSFGSGWKNGGSMKKKPSMKKGGSFPDLNKDGKVTKKDVLIGRGVLPKTAKKGMKMKKAQLGDTLKVNPVRQQLNWEKEMSAAKTKNKSKASSSKMTPSIKKNKMGGMTKKCAYGCK